MPDRAFVPTEPEALSEAVNRLTAAGYVHELRACPGGRLREAKSGREYSPEELIVDEVVRFEGPSDPGDESMVLALRERNGPLRGTYTTSFGMSVSGAEAEVLRRLPMKPGAGAAGA